MVQYSRCFITLASAKLCSELHLKAAAAGILCLYFVYVWFSARVIVRVSLSEYIYVGKVVDAETGWCRFPGSDDGVICYI